MPAGTVNIGGSASCIISGNMITSSNFYDGTTEGTVYAYQHGGIWVRNSAVITNNIFKTTTPTTTPTVDVEDIVLILLSNGEDFNVTNNFLYRDVVSIGNYVGFKFLDNYPAGVGLENSCNGIITNNYFDNYYTNGSSTETVDLNINGTMGVSSQWTVDRNINQTEVIRLLIEDGMIYNRDNIHISQAGATTNVIAYNNDGYFSNVLIDFTTVNNTTFGILYNLSSIMPYGTRLINATASHGCNTYSGTKTAYFMQMALYANGSYKIVVVDYPNSNTDYSTVLTPSSTVVNNQHNTATSAIKLSLEFTAEISTITAHADFYYVDVTFRW